MTGELVSIIVLLLFLVLLAAEMPVAVALGASGSVGVIMLNNVSVAGSVLKAVPFEATAQYSLVVLPMYILLGAAAASALIPERAYSFFNRFTGKLPGGVGIATIAASAGFAAVSGSSVATAATLSRTSIGAMLRRGFTPHFATGIVAIGATLGILIPPSIIMVLYSIMTGESIAAMFAAGVIPGLISAAAYMLVIAVVMSRKSNRERVVSYATSGDEAGPNATPAAVRKLLAAAEQSSTLGQEARAILWLVLIVAVVMLGIFTGIMTTTESAAVSAIVALLILAIEKWRSGVRQLARSMTDALAETASITSMAFAVIIGAGIFSYFLISAGVPNSVSVWLTALDVPPMVIVALVLLALVPLGMFLDGFAMMVITVPIIYPTLEAFGLSGVWFGVLMVKMIEIGLLTPPFGMNCFVITAATGIKLETVFRGVMPFIVLELCLVALFMFVPELVLWLPDLVAKR